MCVCVRVLGKLDHNTYTSKLDILVCAVFSNICPQSLLVSIQKGTKTYKFKFFFMIHFLLKPEFRRGYL